MPPVPSPQALSLRTVTRQTADTVTLRIDSTLRYAPGQAVAIQFPSDTKKRYFSISSSPTESGFLEVTIKADPESPFGQLLSTLKRGNVLLVEGPAGSFSLPSPLATPICFVAAGTGVTPFRSMIKYLLDTDAGSQLWLLHSVKAQKDLLFQTEFQEWSGQDKRFHYVPTITQDFDDNWDNETGRIKEAMLRKHIPAGPCTYCLCGPTSFVNDMEALLRDQMAIPAASIRREQW